MQRSKKQSSRSRQQSNRKRAVGSSHFETGLLLRLTFHRYKNHTTISLAYRRPDFSWLNVRSKNNQPKLSRALGVILILAGIIGIGSVIGPSVFVARRAANASQSPVVTASSLLGSTAQPHIQKPYVMQESIPVRLEVPDLGLRADLLRTSVGPEGELVVPASATEGAWYDHSPTPGELGPSILVGHVSSYFGDAVFAGLHTLSVGADIWIERADGSRPHFRVEKVSSYPQHQFPTQEVYGSTDYAGLRLVTCAGSYDYSTGRYTDNTVVFARLVQE